VQCQEGVAPAAADCCCCAMARSPMADLDCGAVSWRRLLTWAVYNGETQRHSVAWAHTHRILWPVSVAVSAVAAMSVGASAVYLSYVLVSLLSAALLALALRPALRGVEGLWAHACGRGRRRRIGDQQQQHAGQVAGAPAAAGGGTRCDSSRQLGRLSRALSAGVVVLGFCAGCYALAHVRALCPLPCSAADEPSSALV
jgi:hypothetical protein